MKLNRTVATLGVLVLLCVLAYVLPGSREILVPVIASVALAITGIQAGRGKDSAKAPVDDSVKSEA